MTHIIIGAGITGLYTAYKLIKVKHIDPTKIIIFEKTQRVGGRIYTYQNYDHPQYRYDVGAGRLGSKHKYVMKLIKELGLEDKLVSIKSPNNYFIDGKYMTEKELLVHFRSKFKSLSDCWKYAITTKPPVNVNPKYMNLEGYFHTVLPTNEVNMLSKSLGYISEMYEMNAYNALNTIRKDFDVENNDFYVMSGGIQTICDKLKEYLRLVGVLFVFDSYLKDIDDKNKYCRIETSLKSHKYKYEKLYITITRKDYTNIPYFDKYRDLFESVSDGTLLRIYAKYPSSSQSPCWFKDMPKIVTDNKLLFIIPIDYETGLIQISYSDSHCAKFWNNITREREVRMMINKYLTEIFSTKKIPEPEWVTFHYWKNGVHYYKVGECSDTVKNKMYEIFEPKGIYILGETYCKRQAWVDGAMESVNKILLDKKNTSGLYKTKSMKEKITKINGKKYDLEPFIYEHPGGSQNITKIVNKNGSDKFNRCPFHNTEIKKYILNMLKK